MVHVHMLVGGALDVELRELKFASIPGARLPAAPRCTFNHAQQAPLDRARIFTYLFKWKLYTRDRQHGGRARRPPMEVHKTDPPWFLAAHSFERLSFTYNLGGRGALWASPPRGVRARWRSLRAACQQHTNASG